MSAADEELVTVMIPARNEEHFIEEALGSVAAQTYRNLDIVVVDGDSDDETVRVVNDFAARDPRVRCVQNPARITPSALNVGLREARGKWLVRVDAHSTVSDNYVARAVEHLRTGKYGGVGGRLHCVGLTSAGRAIAAALESKVVVGNSTFHYATDAHVVVHVPFPAYPVALARELGGWNEELPVNQDFEFDWRITEAGHPILVEPAMHIYWICRQSVGALWKQYLRYGRGKARVAALHPRSLSLRHLALPLLVAYLAAAVVLAVFRPVWAALAVAPYLLAVAGASVLTARQLQRGDRKYLPAILLAMHIAWGLGFWRGLVDVVKPGR